MKINTDVHEVGVMDKLEILTAGLSYQLQLDMPIGEAISETLEEGIQIVSQLLKLLESFTWEEIETAFGKAKVSAERANEKYLDMVTK